MMGAKFVAAWVSAAWICVSLGAAQAAPSEEQDEGKPSACLSSPKGTAPAGERWFYRVERGTKRHCWYTRAGGARRVAEPVPQKASTPVKVAEPSPPPPPPQLDQSVANARAEADLSAAASVATQEPSREVDHANWQLAGRWSDHQNGGAPFEARPVTPPPPLPITPQAAPDEADDVSLRKMFEIAGGAFGFAAIASVLVFTFARRRQKREETSGFALFAKTDDPKRRLLARRTDDLPPGNLRPHLEHGDDFPPMRPFTPRNMRMDRA